MNKANEVEIPDVLVAHARPDVSLSLIRKVRRGWRNDRKGINNTVKQIADCIEGIRQQSLKRLKVLNNTKTQNTLHENQIKHETNIPIEEAQKKETPV